MDRAAASYGPCDDSCKDRRPTVGHVALGVLVAGAVLTPVGWAMFARNRNPSVEARRLGSTQRSAPSPRFGIGAGPLKGGTAAGAWVSF